MASIRFKDIRKVYGNDVEVIKKFNLEIKDGEFVVLVGPSGCGKSTLLRMVAGLETVTEGTIQIANRIVNDVDAKDRDIAMVFQNYALYPHMNIFENMAFGLKLQKHSSHEIEHRVKEAADILEINEFLHRRPKELSGGQRQRVALGRAIVRKPKVFLFDEPLSNLDAKLRTQMRAEIKKLHDRLKTTMIYVTHDQVEAMTMGDRIVILNYGIAQQVGSPAEVYNMPTNTFVAGFIGSPSMNFLKGSLNNGNFISRDFSMEAGEKFKGMNNSNVVMGVRPENVPLTREGNTLELTLLEPLGSETILHLQGAEAKITAKVPGNFNAKHGEGFGLKLDTEKIILFDGQNTNRLAD